MSCLDVVVPHIACVVFQVVEHGSAYVGRGRVDVVVVIGYGLSLQDVSVIEKQYVVAVLLALGVHEGGNPCQTALLWAPVDKVVGEISPMYVTCLQQFDGNFFGVRCLYAQHASGAEQRHKIVSDMHKFGFM